MSTKTHHEEQLSIWLGDASKQVGTNRLMSTLDDLYATPPEDEAFNFPEEKLLQMLSGFMPKPLYYDLLPNTDVGDIWLAASEDGLVAIDFDQSEEAFNEYLKSKLGGNPIRSEEKIIHFHRQVRDYLNGNSLVMEADIDLSKLTEFQREVLTAASKVPRGQVLTYGEIAERIGKPKAFRAVGQALRRNPIPIVIPCHRVIAADGTLGGYGGRMGSMRKLNLLKLEGVILA
ncbi:MAG: methylated-DNA--[protein]-cysteine S-methyltransferase [Anaerolineae bacterium]|nr:methylated-DNA--[protein]-cysteine S-methyltransferase [Anaerolineae bacterium]